MNICCDICLDDVKSIIEFCDCCKNIQCFNCIISFDRKCSFCSKNINIYEVLLFSENDYLLEDITKFLNKKIYNLYKKYFGDINIMNKFINLWILSDLFSNSTDMLTITNLYNNILIQKIKNNFLLMNKNINCLTKFANKDTLNNLLNVSVNIKNHENIVEVTEYKLNDLKINMFKFFNENYYNSFNNNINLIKCMDINNNILEFEEEEWFTKLKQESIEITKKLESIILDKNNSELFFFSFLKYFTNPFFNYDNKCKCNKISCDFCNTVYCKKCICVLNNTQKHLCIENSNIDYEEIKICPGCKILVLKDSGCDDMWCLNCKIFFSWKHGFIRTDKPHNPDYYEFMNLKINSDRTLIKQVILQELIEEFNCDIGDEDSLILDCISDSEFLERDINKNIYEYLIPNLLKQVYVVNILKIDTIVDRDFSTLNNIINLTLKYRNNIIKICGEMAYNLYWSTIIYENIKIKTNSCKINYKNFTF